MRSLICTILCLLTMMGFATIFVQEHWKPFEMKPLQGFTPVVEKPALTFANFATGHYQATAEQYIRDHFGFREFLIRVYNQFAYSGFRVITNDNIVEGANRELYLKMYLNDATGKTLPMYFADVERAKAEARKNVTETLQLIDTLRQHGTQFLFVFAPTKTATYPEMMPRRYQQQIADFSLEEYYIQLFKENNIPHIDFYHHFQTLKDDVVYPLYPRTGTHWAESIIPYVADSVLKKLAEVTGYKLPSVRYVADNLTTDYSVQDGELEASMNLLFPLNKPAIPRPVFELTDTIGVDKPNLLVIGDSYFTQLANSPFTGAFSNWEFWVYNRDVQSSDNRHKWKPLETLLDADEVLDNAHIVMAVFTAPMYYQYMFGFTQTAQNLYHYGVISDEAGIQAVIQLIKDDEQWMKGIEKQAEERGITIEENLRRNAQYFIEERQRKKNLTD